MKSTIVVSSCARQLTVGASIAGLVLTMALASPANAGGGNSDRANAMAGVLSGAPGIGGAAKTVSGNDQRSASGWGNTGSAVLSGGSITEGAKQQGKN